MKILYSIQATGNGHISRAMELLPYLRTYGKTDLFLSGANSSLKLNEPVKYRSKGLSLFYTCMGTLDYMKIFRKLAPFRIMQEAKDLPVEKYDVVINDFDSITSLACAYKKISSIHFGHQASFISDKVPRPAKRSSVGEWILKNYTKASKNIGLHFESYDHFILSPVIKQSNIEASPVDDGHITVYLPSYCENQLIKALFPIKDYRFQIFSKETALIREMGHLTFIPVDKSRFNKSLISCHGIITGAGFETPSEALYLRKKMIVIPIKGQYEQQCNAAALEKIGVKIINTLDDGFPGTFSNWINEIRVPFITFPHSTKKIVEQVMFTALEDRNWEPLNSSDFSMQCLV